jgi:E3 ubiquitin-protein ligase CCNP1IP1
MRKEMQLNQEQLHKKNEELIVMYQEKCKKHTQMTNLYNLLKGRAMRSQIQTAASDSISHTLNSLAGTSKAHKLSLNPGSNTNRQTSRHFNAIPRDQNGTEQLLRHQRTGSSGSRNGPLAELRRMPPPKLPFASGKSMFPAAKFRLF